MFDYTGIIYLPSCGTRKVDSFTEDQLLEKEYPEVIIDGERWIRKFKVDTEFLEDFAISDIFSSELRRALGFEAVEYRIINDERNPWFVGKIFLGEDEGYLPYNSLYMNGHDHFNVEDIALQLSDRCELDFNNVLEKICQIYSIDLLFGVHDRVPNNLGVIYRYGKGISITTREGKIPCELGRLTPAFDSGYNQVTRRYKKWGIPSKEDSLLWCKINRELIDLGAGIPNTIEKDIEVVYQSLLSSYPEFKQSLDKTRDVLLERLKDIRFIS